MTGEERTKRLAELRERFELPKYAKKAAKIEYIALYYGWEAQSRQCIEEMAEAIKAINKLWRYERGYLPKGTITAEELKKHIIEELVDTEICIEQLMSLLQGDFVGVWAIFDKIYFEKLDREIQRIAEREVEEHDKS